ncbi:carboxymuconolactone decarboxylase family protein [Flagellimonas sp.]|uniref:carboxymuconolactone decarboxylase family protein n=1 Tax=Flagellimonas sp. TaxID=2058762 RepID=UPI003AB72052
MENRINLNEKGGTALQVLSVLGSYLKRSLIEKELQHLVHLRLSQIEGDTDGHGIEIDGVIEATQIGPFLCALNVWEEAECFTPREKAALRWSEAVMGKKVDDGVYEAVRTILTDEELIDLTLLVTNWNTWSMVHTALNDQ